MNLDKYINLSSGSFSEGMATREDQVHAHEPNKITNATIDELNKDIESDPNNPANYLKKGIALSRASLHHQEAIDTFSYGLALDPFNAMLYRWRGHKFINVRQFNAANADLELSTRLDPSNWDTWYHLGLGYYLLGDFARAEVAYQRCWALTDNNDKRVAIADWLYMTLMRLGKTDEATGILDSIPVDIELVEQWATDSYFRRILLYKGLESAEALLVDVDTSSADFVTLGYGLGNYYFCAGEKEKAAEIWQTVLDGQYWSALGYVASEADLKRMNEQAAN